MGVGMVVFWGGWRVGRGGGLIWVEHFSESVGRTGSPRSRGGAESVGPVANRRSLLVAAFEEDGLAVFGDDEGVEVAVEVVVAGDGELEFAAGEDGDGGEAEAVGFHLEVGVDLVEQIDELVDGVVEWFGDEAAAVGLVDAVEEGDAVAGGSGALDDGDENELFEGVAFVLDGGVGRGFVFFEEVVALFEVFPEGFPLVALGAGHALGGHAEGEAVDAEVGLAVFEGGIAEGVDLLDLGIGHGEAADGDLVAMDHEGGAGATVGLIVFVGVAEVEGEVEVGVGVHGGGGDEVETLGSLAVAFGEFGAEFAGHGGDIVGAEVLECLLAWLLDPEFEFAFLLEDAEEDGAAEGKVGVGELAGEDGADAVGGGTVAAGFAAEFGGHGGGDEEGEQGKEGPHVTMRVCL